MTAAGEDFIEAQEQVLYRSSSCRNVELLCYDNTDFGMKLADCEEVRGLGDAWVEEKKNVSGSPPTYISRYRH